MGKQIRFFMTYGDEKDFLDSVRELGPLSVIFNTFTDESAMEVQSLQPVGISVFNNNLSLVNPTIVGAVKYEFYPSQAYYCIDLAESEVVQFNRCKSVDSWLANGRLWFDEKTSQGKKSAAFSKWANSLLRWIRSHYERDASGLYFVAPKALELSKAGKLQLGPSAEPSLSLEERKRILGIE